MDLWSQLQLPSKLPSPWQVALGNAGRAASREELREGMLAAHLAGRKHEAKASYEGAGYKFDIQPGPDLLIPPEPPIIGKSPGRAKKPPVGAFKHAPDPNRLYDMGTARRQLGKTFETLQPWTEHIFTAGGLLPVGESIQLFAGPVTLPRSYRITIGRYPLRD